MRQQQFKTMLFLIGYVRVQQVLIKGQVLVMLASGADYRIIMYTKIVDYVEAAK